MATRGFWEEELAPEELEKLCQRAAQEITKRRLEAPAVLLLEMHKPIANFNAHLALGAAGFLAPMVGFELYNDLTRLLAKRDNIDRLLEEIESQAGNRGKSVPEDRAETPCNTTTQAG